MLKVLRKMIVFRVVEHEGSRCSMCEGELEKGTVKAIQTIHIKDFYLRKQIHYTCFLKELRKEYTSYLKDKELRKENRKAKQGERARIRYWKRVGNEEVRAEIYSIKQILKGKSERPELVQELKELSAKLS